MSDHERYEILLVKATDGQLDAEERRTLDEHLTGCAACRAELEDFNLIKETTDAMTERILADATIEPPREPGTARGILGLGFVLLLCGALLLLGFAGYTLFSDARVPLIVKAGTGALGLGVLVLSAYVAALRRRAARRDPYKEIDL
jgi:anti-sigma factor RsiW